MSIPIPQPPGVPLLGNIWDIDPKQTLLSLQHIADKYGPIFKLSVLGRERFFACSVELLNELCDEKRFCKSVTGPLEQVRNGIGDGLFTAYHGEHNWGVAHRTLVPAFGPIGIKDMFNEMYDIGTQLVAKWARMGSDVAINVTDDYTRLTLDSIALCAMDKRFNSFYHDEMHPFVGAMVDFLVESGVRARRSRVETYFNPQYQRKYEADIKIMQDVATEVIAYRRANPSDKKDLLNVLLFGKDPQTGERLTDESIMNNMITFLIAGHETTSGMLSFTSYYLLKNHEAMRKAQEEVDRVVGTGPVTFQHMSKLPYLEACLRESLRLSPTAPVFTIRSLSKEAELIGGGKYVIPAGQSMSCFLPAMGRDTSVFGEDANEYRPERMYGENFTNLPPNAWKPFGNGARGCIGRPFAWQEALMALALILQNFNLRMDDSTYQLKIKQTLTVKPDGFFMRATLRDGIDPVNLEKKMFAGVPEPEKAKKAEVHVQLAGKDAKPMTVLYGSNSGTCEGLAQTLAGAAGGHGYQATVKPLDAAVDKLPTDHPVVIVTASYEGQPPDNAGQFVAWLNTVKEPKIKGTKFAVFGCGHHDWASTFHKIPKLIDATLAEKGGERIASIGGSDVAQGTVFDDFDSWLDGSLWPAISQKSSDTADVEEGLDMEISTSTRANHLHHGVQDAQVLENYLLRKPDQPDARHMAFQLPTNMTYEAGDYLAVLPVNPIATISRVLRRFGLPFDATMTLKKGAHTTIPTEKELGVTAILGAYVELSNPATKKNIATIAKYADADKIDFVAESPLSQAPMSVLDILEKNLKIPLPFSVFMSMLTPMRIRQYSISSSPLADPTVASISFAVVENHDADEAGNPHLGVATNYLKSLKPGSIVQLSVKKSHKSFKLPLNDENTPVIMIAAGTGIAPFRGFVMERVEKIKAGKKLAEAALFVGCRNDEDALYKDVLKEWEDFGAVKIYYAFSRDEAKTGGSKYAQDRVWQEREEVRRLFRTGAKAYICGSSRLGKGVADVAARIVEEEKERDGEEFTHEEGLKWWEGLRGERFAVDVFD